MDVNVQMFLESCLAQEPHNHTHEHTKFCFEPIKTHIIHDGYRYMFRWDNGIGASVICNDTSYFEFELAVLYNNELNYNTGITNDVIPGLTVEDVNAVLHNIDLNYGRLSTEDLASFMSNAELERLAMMEDAE